MGILSISKNRTTSAPTCVCATHPTPRSPSQMETCAELLLAPGCTCFVHAGLLLTLQKITMNERKDELLLPSWSLTLCKYHLSFRTILQEEELEMMNVFCSLIDESRKLSPGSSMGKEENKYSPLLSPPTLHPHTSFPSSLFLSLECQTVTGSLWQTSSIFFLKSYPKNNEYYYTSFTAM